MIIKSVDFKNFKALRDATLPLGRFALIVGPNGSGKSTAMQAIDMAINHFKIDIASKSVLPVELPKNLSTAVQVKIHFDFPQGDLWSVMEWVFTSPNSIEINGPRIEYSEVSDEYVNQNIELIEKLKRKLSSFRIFSFDASAISPSVTLHPYLELAPDGRNMAGVLDNLRDSEPERFEELNENLKTWLPEYDRILFSTTGKGERAFSLRTKTGRHRIQAKDLSHGTLLALAYLTIAYLPNPPAIVCFEEPERGIHPRLLRDIRDAMYRLAYPEDYGELRPPVQVIATTHSPYMLDLYKDHPEEIVIAEKDERGVHFERLSDKPNIDQYLQDAPLGEVWYSGVLGGVPHHP